MIFPGILWEISKPVLGLIDALQALFNFLYLTPDLWKAKIRCCQRRFEPLIKRGNGCLRRSVWLPIDSK